MIGDWMALIMQGYTHTLHASALLMMMLHGASKPPMPSKPMHGRACSRSGTHVRATALQGGRQARQQAHSTWVSS